MSLSNGDKLKNGKYTIIGNPLGKGSYGTTYKARDHSSETNVAIKTLNKEVKHPDYENDLERFTREITVLKKLSGHPNIVKYHDDFKENERHYLVMEFLSEETLFTLVENEGALPDWLALDYIYQIGSALKALHKKHWVHRDVYPKNIMIVKNKVQTKAVLIDFGIVKNRHLLTNEHPTNTYFTPYEQRYGNFDPKVDIYALAACLYYALTAELPTPSVDRMRNEPLIPPRKHNPSISPKVEKAILRGMEREAKKRPQSMQEWLNLLPKSKFWLWQQLIEVGQLIANCLNKFFQLT
ncbi:MAG: serine/threonine protein kinase [Brasilonema sp.]